MPEPRRRSRFFRIAAWLVFFAFLAGLGYLIHFLLPDRARWTLRGVEAVKEIKILGDRVVTVSAHEFDRAPTTPGSRLILERPSGPVIARDLATGEMRHEWLRAVRVFESHRFSPDGRFLVALGEKGDLHVADLVKGEVSRPLDAAVASFALSPGGKYLACFTTERDPKGEVRATMQVIDLETGARHLDLGKTERVVFSPDDRRLLRTIKQDGKDAGECWDLALKQKVYVVPGLQKFVAVQSDGSRFLATVNDRASLFTFDSDKPLALDPPCPDFDLVAFSSDGRFLVTVHFLGGTAGKEVEIWDTSDGRLLGAVSAPGVEDVMSHGGMVAVRYRPGQESKVGLLDLERRAIVWSRPVSGVASLAGQVVIAHDPHEGRLDILEARTGDLKHRLLIDRSAGMWSLAVFADTLQVTPDGKHLWAHITTRQPPPEGWFSRWWPWRRQAGMSHSVTVIDCERGAITGRIESLKPVAVALSGDGRTLVTWRQEEDENVLEAWDLPLGKANAWLAWLPLALGVALLLYPFCRPC